MESEGTWLVIAGLLLGWLVVAMGMRGRKRRTTALFVFNGGEPILEEKMPMLARLLGAGMKARGFSTLSPGGPVIACREGKPFLDSATLNHARGLGAEYVLIVAMHELSCRVDESRMRNLAALRVDTTLCVGFQLIDAGSGRLLAEEALALCRTTTPIVSGTQVGSEVIDRLLSEVAGQIADHLGSLPLAA
jgi:hypothetical protein